MPISYDFIGDSDIPVELGTQNYFKNLSLSVVVSGENKVQTVNLADFISRLLLTTQPAVYNYNVVGNPQIGVLKFEDIVKTRMFDVFPETNLARKFSVSITADAIVDYDNNYTTR